jgi:hemerythrin-like domain-containing protein
VKRHPALIPLSRDHHQVLVIAQRLRRATAESATETAQAFLSHWKEERWHFRLEEELLLPAYAAEGEPDHPAIIRMLCDHMLIRRDAARVADSPSLELLHDLGALLASHVRLEEQEIFPLIEATLPESDLQELGERIRAQSRCSATKHG